MARALASLGTLLVVVSSSGLARASEVEDVAAAAGVDPQDLAGAVNSTGLAAHEYLIAVGEVKGPARTPAPAAPAASVWTRLAACESTSRWFLATGNGYYGGLQQDMTFWRRHGGLQYAPRPDLASPAQQIAVAERGLAAQGWGAWPVCSRVIGVR